MIFFRVAVEGRLDAEVAQRILRSCGAEPQVPPVIANGRTSLIKNIRGYAQAANYMPWLVLCDLDYDECPPTLIEHRIRTRIPASPPLLCFRVAVRTVEAWLLADPALATFLGINTALLPGRPEHETRPKDKLVELALRSPRPEIRNGVGGDRKTAQPGGSYTHELSHFVRNHWNPQRAAQRSPSLQRTLNAVQHLANP